jgi:MFS transporter, PAT family, beta-lactamase induction signal transducer AmpG
VQVAPSRNTQREPSASDHGDGHDAAPVEHPEPKARAAALSLPEAPAAAEPPGSLGQREDATREAVAVPWVASTYFAEGLPYSLVHQTAAQFFVAMGASLHATGLTALYGLAWNFKFAWSPLVDRHGTQKRWLYGTEAALAITVAALAIPAGRGDLGLVARGLVVVSLLAATHDIAVDGFYLRVLPGRRAQAALSGLRVTAYRAALFVGNGALVALAGLTSWRVCFGFGAALLFALAVGHAALLPREERPRAEASPGTDAPRAAAPRSAAAPPRYVDAFLSFLQQPQIGVSLAFIVLFRAGDALMFAMNAPLLRSLGYGTIGRGFLGGLATAGAIAGAVLGGAVIARVGQRRALFPMTLAQSLAILLYVGLAAARPGLPLTVVVVVVEQIVAGMGNAALMVFLMHRCRGEYQSSHFAVGSALMSLATTTVGAASGYLAERVGFPTFFAIAFAASLPGVALARFAPKE